MRRTLALIFVLGLGAFGAFVLTSEALPANCTEVGTDNPDILAGTNGPDRICALAGNDYAHADGKQDVVFGMGGRDTLVGGGGRDVLKGGGGGDKIFSIDQREGNDVIYGGPGDDNCFADFTDRVHGCEHVHRVGSSRAGDATIAALERALLGESLLGEQFQEDAASPAPPIFPACSPPPRFSPPPCT
jgi:Ca2+-binding RTX toxin-like protein